MHLDIDVELLDICLFSAFTRIPEALIHQEGQDGFGIKIPGVFSFYY